MPSPFVVEPIPQRESLPDKKRQKILAKLPPEQQEFLPPTPATVIIYGAIGAGKSSLLYSWLKNILPNYYDECVVFSGSQDSKEAFEALPQKRICFLSDYDNEAFTAYINQLKADQLERMANGKRPLNICVCFDDIVFSQSISKTGKPSMAQRLMLICRHELNTSVLICVQHSKQVNPAMRNNALLHIINRLSRNDLEKVAAEHCNHLTEKEFIDMYYDIIKEPHQFLLVDYKAPFHRRFRQGFNKYYDNSSRKNASPLQELTVKRSEDTGPNV